MFAPAAASERSCLTACCRSTPIATSKLQLSSFLCWLFLDLGFAPRAFLVIPVAVFETSLSLDLLALAGAALPVIAPAAFEVPAPASAATVGLPLARASSAHAPARGPVCQLAQRNTRRLDQDRNESVPEFLWAAQ